MFKKHIVSLLLLIIAAGMLMVPAYAQTGNYTISGKIAFPNETNYNNVTVTDLTISVLDFTGFEAAKVSPAADGSFKATVDTPGMYNFSVYPHELTLANLTTNTSYLYQYPDNQNRFQSVHVNNSTPSVTVNIVGVTTQVITPTPEVHYPPTATPTKTPGFSALLLFVGLICAAAIVALVGITAGTLYQKRFGGGIDWRPALFLQYGAAGTLFALGAAVFETWSVRWTPEFLFAVGWLVFVLSFGAVWLLYFLIRRAAATRVVSLFYLTPPVTALMAWALFGERLSPLALVGMAVCVAGVFLVNWRPAT